MNVSSSISRHTRGRVYERDEYSCIYCGTPGKPEELTLDHIIPMHVKRGYYPGELQGIPFKEIKLNSYSLRGSYNLVTACSTCNNERGRKPLKKFFKSRPASKERFLKRTEGFLDKRILEDIVAAA